VVGKILENTGNFISNDFNSETGTKFGTDVAFEILPSVASKGIKSLNVNTVAENIVKDAAVKAGFTTLNATATLDFDWWLLKYL
jgi:FKBP-type peptidyl-prolyl cis-trans isomerase (trigger factor)